MGIAVSDDNPQQHNVFTLNVVNTGRRVSQIVRAGIILPNIMSDEERATGAKLIDSIRTLFDSSSGEQIILTEKTPYTFRLDPFEWIEDLYGSRMGEAFVEDSTGERHTTTFAIVMTPKQAEAWQESIPTAPTEETIDQ